jgi:hypothetical protein
VASREEAQILQQQGQGLAHLQSVAGGIGEEESALSNSKSSLDSREAEPFILDFQLSGFVPQSLGFSPRFVRVDLRIDC